jgi:hypothetical protein
MEVGGKLWNRSFGTHESVIPEIKLFSYPKIPLVTNFYEFVWCMLLCSGITISTVGIL